MCMSREGEEERGCVYEIGRKVEKKGLLEAFQWGWNILQHSANSAIGEGGGIIVFTY